MELDEKKYLYLLILLPLLVVVFLYNLYWKRKKQREFGSVEMVQKLSPDSSSFKSVLKLIVIVLAFASLILGLVNPKIGTKMETVKRIHAQNEASGLLLPETLGFGKSILRIYSPLPLAARATHR